MVLGKENKWLDEMSWGSLDNRTLIRIFLRKAEELWHRGQSKQLLLKQAQTIYLNLLYSDPSDKPCARIFALASSFVNEVAYIYISNCYTMKWANPIKYKIKAAFIFAGLTALLLLANLLERNNVADLNKTMISMRNDRLLPATFAYQIDHLLYENKFLLAINKSSTKIKANMDSIETIAKKYEATVLTPDEAAKWTLFRLQLKQVPLTFNARKSPQQAALQEVHFNQLLLSLDQLVQIQVSESARLMDNGKKAVSSHVLLSNLVACLCLIFGLVTLVLLSLSHYSLHKPVKGHMLN